jgi:hypothetical protein
MEWKDYEGVPKELIEVNESTTGTNGETGEMLDSYKPNKARLCILMA